MKPTTRTSVSSITASSRAPTAHSPSTSCPTCSPASRSACSTFPRRRTSRSASQRMPLDIQVVFSANPEDYTNRGNIITPGATVPARRRPLSTGARAGHRHTAQVGGPRPGVTVKVPSFMRELVRGGHPGAQERVRGPELRRLGTLADRADQKPVSNAERRGLTIASARCGPGCATRRTRSRR